MNKTEPITQSNHDANYAEVLNSIKFSLAAMDDFIPQLPAIYKYFFEEQTEIDDTILYKTQQQDPVLRQLLFWKQYKNFSPTPSLTIRANKGLLHYYRRFQNLSINEDNNLLYYIQETSPKFVCHFLFYLSFSIKHTPIIFQDTQVVKKHTRQSREITIFQTLIHG